MKQILRNALFGVLDYVAYPLGMLLAAPVVLKNLGAEAYGVWSLSTALVSMGSIITSGFGDANIQLVSRHRDQRDGLAGVVETLLGINFLLAAAMAAILCCAAPVLAMYAVRVPGELRSDCVLCVALAAVAVGLRTAESVCVSTQRAFERYGAAMRISVAARLLSLFFGAFLTFFVHRVSIIVLTSLIFGGPALLLQLRHLRSLLAVKALRPRFRKNASVDFLRLGFYSWLLALSGTVVGQADRLVLGVSVGAATLAGYALCAQLAQPLYGLPAAGLHFLFPYLAGRSAGRAPSDLKTPIAIAAISNLAFVGVATFLLQVFGPAILLRLGQGKLQPSATAMLPGVLWSTALLGVSVTPTYALYAFGRFRTVMFLTTGGAVACGLIMLCFARVHGASAVIGARFVYAIVSLLLFVPLLRILHPSAHRDAEMLVPLCEEA